MEVTTNTYAVIERWFTNAILHIKSRIRKKNSQNNTLFRAELSAETEDIRIEEKK